MDVRCERCKTEYDFDDARITEAGVAVKCTTCGHVFKVKKKAVVVTVPVKPGESETPTAAALGASPAERPKEWKVRQASGNVFTFRELTTLQKWIVERKVTRDDQISLTGESWKRLGNIAELASFFQVVDDALKGQQLVALQQQGLLALPQPPAVSPLLPANSGAPLSPAPLAPIPPPVGGFGGAAGPTGPTGPTSSIGSRPTPPPPPREAPPPKPLINGKTGEPILGPEQLTPMSALGEEADVDPHEFAGPQGGLPPPPALNAVVPQRNGPATATPAGLGSINPGANPSSPSVGVEDDDEDERPRSRAIPILVVAVLLLGGAWAYMALYVPWQKAHPGQSLLGGPKPATSPSATAATPPPATAPDKVTGSAASDTAAPSEAADAGAAVAAPTAAPTAAPSETAAADAGTPAAKPAVEVAAANPPPPAGKKVPVVLDFDGYMAQGDRLRERERPLLAIESYNKASNLSPNRAEPVTGRGLAQLDLGQQRQAVASFQKALGLNPRYGVALMGLAEAYRSLGQTDDAAKYYQRYLDAFPDGSEAPVARRALEKLKTTSAPPAAPAGDPAAAPGPAPATPPVGAEQGSGQSSGPAPSQSPSGPQSE